MKQNMEAIYQLKLELKDSSPKIWRRIQVSGNTSFSDLHDIIQLTMGWENEHLYEFYINGFKIHDFGENFDDGSNPKERDSLDTFLDELVNLTKSKFRYVYDLGDNWEHEMEVEKIFTAENNQTYPICVSGEGACPPENCGGIWGYKELLNILADKDHSEHEETVSWLGDDWDANSFNCKHANLLLKDYADQWEEIFKETEEILDALEDNYVDGDDWDDDLNIDSKDEK